MRSRYLGDSYDLVKRFWAESLRSVAPLYAHPRFIPTTIQKQYTAVTSIPIVDIDSLPGEPYGLLLDPHTGIRLPTKSIGKASVSHATLPFIVQVNLTLHPAYVICFDQSYHRGHALTRTQQLDTKRKFLDGNGLSSFYYNSHAPFLFVARQSEWLSTVKNQLISRGVPDDRFELRSS